MLSNLPKNNVPYELQWLIFSRHVDICHDHALDAEQCEWIAVSNDTGLHAKICDGVGWWPVLTCFGTFSNLRVATLLSCNVLQPLGPDFAYLSLLDRIEEILVISTLKLKSQSVTQLFDLSKVNYRVFEITL